MKICILTNLSLLQQYVGSFVGFLYSLVELSAACFVQYYMNYQNFQHAKNRGHPHRSYNYHYILRADS